MSKQKLYSRLVFYPTYYWNRLCADVFRFRRWWDFIDEHVIVGALPRASLVPAMHAAGVRAAVNTCEEYAGPVAEYEQLGIEQFYMPTIDFTHPLLDDVEAAVSFVNKHVALGNTVYIHCKAGRARSATVAICWLIDNKKMAPAEAQELLLEKRPHINPRLIQRPVVIEFAKKRGFDIS